MKTTPNNTIESFFTVLPSRSLEKGDLFLSPGDEPEGVAYLVSGLIRQYDISESGSVVVVNIFKPGAHFPMNWAFNDEKNMWYFEAVEESVVHIAPKDKTLHFFETHPDAMLDFTKRLCSGATGQQRRLAHLMGGGAYTRVLYELTVSLKRFGKNESGSIYVELSESELGELAGLSREAVSRQLTQLKDKKLIETSYKKITVPDIKQLEDELGFTV